MWMHFLLQTVGRKIIPMIASGTGSMHKGRCSYSVHWMYCFSILKPCYSTSILINDLIRLLWDCGRQELCVQRMQLLKTELSGWDNLYHRHYDRIYIRICKLATEQKTIPRLEYLTLFGSLSCDFELLVAEQRLSKSQETSLYSHYRKNHQHCIRCAHANSFVLVIRGKTIQSN